VIGTTLADAGKRCDSLSVHESAAVNREQSYKMQRRRPVRLKLTHDNIFNSNPSPLNPSTSA
jgi:hypothetical protein